MKALKYVIFILVGLLVLFLLLGLLKPVIEYGHEITVDKPINEAWAVHQDETRLGEWLDGFQSIELLTGESGEVGSTYKVVVNPGEGQPDFEMIETINSKQEFDHITLSFDSDMMVFDQTTTFKEEGDQTIIKTDSKVKGKGMMMRSMFAAMEMLGGSFQAQEEKNVEALKALINNNTQDYYPEPVMEEEAAVDSTATEM